MYNGRLDYDQTLLEPQMAEMTVEMTAERRVCLTVDLWARRLAQMPAAATVSRTAGR